MCASVASATGLLRSRQSLVTSVYVTDVHTITLYHIDYRDSCSCGRVLAANRAVAGVPVGKKLTPRKIVYRVYVCGVDGFPQPNRWACFAWEPRTGLAGPYVVTYALTC
jgi:hypothetical protein